MFIDKARIYITAGRGGAGCISFRREKFVPLGGPDGGNGGRGGSIYLVADPHMNTLLDLKYKPHIKAKEGFPGGNSNCNGKCADDLIIKVPLGTIVYKNEELIADLKFPGQKILAAAGGRGGRGNASFKTGRHTAPRIAEKGEPGEKIILDLELKLIADIGLVGFPNAGKSTLLSRISAARPKIADYPFTTLVPNLGVVSFGDRTFVVADIPGLIEGAHEGKGIGDEFLRHIERTKVIVHIVDIFGFNEKTAYSNFRTINNELALHSKKLVKKPMIVAVNKMDVTGSKAKFSQFKKNLKNFQLFPISAVSGEGIKELLSAVIKMLDTVPVEIDSDFEPIKKYIYEPEFTVNIEDGIFVVGGSKVERLSEMTDFAQEESLRRFQNILKKIGVEEALEAKGITVGDTVRIGKTEFSFEK